MLARIIVFIFTIGLGFLPQQLQAQTVIDTVCAGAQGETYSVTNTSGSTYTWEVQGGVLIDGQGSSSVSVDWGNDTGIFELNVHEINKRGCPGDTVRAFVWIRKGLNVDVVGPRAVCVGQPIILSATGASKYVWSTGEPGNSITYTPTTSESLFVIGQSACGVDTAFFYLNVFSKPTAKANISPANPRPEDVVEFLYAGQKVKKVIWNLPDRYSVEGEQVNYSFGETGKFKIELIAVDANGCADTTVKTVEVKPDVHVYIPNAFTPNSDDLNEKFGPEVYDVKEVNMRIINRWGQIIFDQRGPNVEWDGTHQGRLSPDGIYVYLIEVIGKDDKKYVYEGTVHLIR